MKHNHCHAKKNLLRRPLPAYWVSGSGDRVLIGAMHDGHLYNALAYVLRGAGSLRQAVCRQALQKELVRRFGISAMRAIEAGMPSEWNPEYARRPPRTRRSRFA